MRVSTKRILSIGFAFLFIVGTFFVYSIFIRPEIENVSKLRGEASAKENVFLNQQEAVDQVESLMTQIQGSEQLREVVSLAIPVRENTTQAMNQLNAVVRTSNVALRSLAVKTQPFEQAKKGSIVKRLGTLEFSLAVQGSYESIRAFLAALEANVRLANVKNVRIIQSGDREFSQVYTLDAVVSMYFQE